VLVFTQVGVTSLLADAKVNTLDGALVHLYKNDYVPTPFSLTADFTTADYTGYAAQAVAAASWNATTLSDGSAGLVGPGLFFDATGSSVTNVIYGYYITDAAGTNTLWAERFDAPRGITGPGTGFTLVPQLNGDSQAG